MPTRLRLVPLALLAAVSAAAGPARPDLEALIVRTLAEMPRRPADRPTTDGFRIRDLRVALSLALMEQSRAPELLARLVADTPVDLDAPVDRYARDLRMAAEAAGAGAARALRAASAPPRDPPPRVPSGRSLRQLMSPTGGHPGAP